MTRRLFLNYLPFLFLIASFFTSCNRSHEKKSGSKDNTLVVKLVATSIEVAQSYVADVQAVQFVEVKPKVEGFVEDVLVDEGEHVKKGQVLFKLSSAELYEEVKEAQANYKQVQAELKMAEVEADRVKRLVEKDIADPLGTGIGGSRCRPFAGTAGQIAFASCGNELFLYDHHISFRRICGPYTV